MLLFGVFLVLAIIGVSLIVWIWERQSPDMFLVMAFVATITVSPLLIMIPTQYAVTLELECVIPMLEQTITEQKELVSGEEASLGGGLEGLEVKRTIQDTIRERNDKIAYAQYINRSCLWLFKVNPAVFDEL